jgi:hypothetical protein
VTTRLVYRTNLQNKFLNIEDGGYGDFDYDDTELNWFLSMSCQAMFPWVYQKLEESSLALVDYGTLEMTKVTPVTSVPERVYLIRDSVELVPVLGWKVNGLDIINIDPWQGSGTSEIDNVDLFSYGPYTISYEDGDQVDHEDCGIPAQFEPLIILGAVIEALESRQDSGVRGDPPPIGQFQEMPLLDRLNTRYQRLLNSLAMSPPGIFM